MFWGWCVPIYNMYEMYVRLPIENHPAPKIPDGRTRTAGPVGRDSRHENSFALVFVPTVLHRRTRTTSTTVTKATKTQVPRRRLLRWNRPTNKISKPNKSAKGTITTVPTLQTIPQLIGQERGKNRGDWRD